MTATHEPRHVETSGCTYTVRCHFLFHAESAELPKTEVHVIEKGGDDPTGRRCIWVRAWHLGEAVDGFASVKSEPGMCRDSPFGGEVVGIRDMYGADGAIWSLVRYDDSRLIWQARYLLLLCGYTLKSREWEYPPCPASRQSSEAWDPEPIGHRDWEITAEMCLGHLSK